MKTRNFQLRREQFIEIEPKPSESEKTQEQLSKRFGPNGEDRLLQKMKDRYNSGSKPETL